jgi:hypothetical protein
MRCGTAVWMVVASACGGTGCAGAAASLDETSNEASSTAGGNDAAEASGISGSAMAAAEPRLDDADWTKTWRRLAAPSISSYGARVAGIPGSWIAVSTRDQDGSKAPPPFLSFVYRSQDGTHWQAIPIGTAEDPLRSSDIAYGAGRYVIAGERNRGAVVLDSTDGETWRERALDGDAGGLSGIVRYVHDHFFFMKISFWSSSDGENWVQPEHAYPFALFSDIAYGNARYLGVGAGTQVSTNGVEWHAAPIPCELPGACIREPLHGDLLEESFDQTFFAEGNFHIRQTFAQDGELRSADGEAWEYVPGPSPDAYVASHFVRLLHGQPKVWLGDSSDPHPLNVVTDPSSESAVISEPVPSDVDYSWSDGLNCSNARCAVIRSALYLVP